MNGKSEGRFAGDISPEEAWSLLSGDETAFLVDVRTTAEWAFVGLPDLTALGKEPLLVEWQRFPAMELNGGFVGELDEALSRQALSRDGPAIFMCRSGGRSLAAARAAAAGGYVTTYNLAGGFEGDLDTDRHRGRQTGWKAAGLPWAQS